MKKSGYTLIELLVCIFFIFMFVGACLLGGCVVRGCIQVQKNGLKTVANEIWNGTNSPSSPQQKTENEKPVAITPTNDRLVMVRDFKRK